MLWVSAGSAASNTTITDVMNPPWAYAHGCGASFRNGAARSVFGTTFCAKQRRRWLRLERKLFKVHHEQGQPVMESRSVPSCKKTERGDTDADQNNIYGAAESRG